MFLRALCQTDVQSYRPAVAVDVVLHINAHSARALIQNGKLGLVVEQSGHLHSDT